MNKDKLIISTFDTLLGPMTAGVIGDHLCMLEFTDKSNPDDHQHIRKDIEIQHVESNQNRLIAQTENQVNRYLKGELSAFELPIKMSGTSFQMEVWSHLLQIPYGKTLSYNQLSVLCGDVKKVRAVGMANGANRIALIIPCHRVIGSDGKLVGYAGGLWRKKKLLEIEAVQSGKTIQLEMEF